MGKNLNFAYDADGDILEVIVGHPRKAISREVADDVFVRFDPRTDEVVGLSILNFKRWFTERHRERSVPVSVEMALSRR